MATTATAQIKRRRPWIAGLLSLISPGVGHIYCGRFGKGLVLFFVDAVALPGMLGVLPMALGYRIGWGASLLAGAGIWVYSILDARRIARRTSPAYALKEYNHCWVYLILILLPLPITVGGAFLAREWMVQAFYVPSKSMYPTIRFGERLLANKTVYRREPVRRGDVIAFVNPNKRHQKNIKRVVALPGDRVAITNNKLSVNGKPVQTTKVGDSQAGGDKQLVGGIFRETNGSATYRIFVPSPTNTAPKDSPGGKTGDLAETVVPNGHCFVLGDNRGRSHDSRKYGPVPLRDIVGRVDYLYYPRWVNLREQPPR